MGANAVRAVAFAQQLSDELVRAIGLVLIDESRCFVDVLRHAVLGASDHGTARQIGRVVGVRRMTDTGAANLDRAVAALGQEIEAVIEVLPERHEEDIAVIGVLRQIGFLRRKHIANCARIEAVEHRIDRHVVCRRIVSAKVSVGEPDERCIGCPKTYMSKIITFATERSNAEHVLAFLFATRCNRRMHDIEQSGKISCCQIEDTCAAVNNFILWSAPDQRVIVAIGNEGNMVGGSKLAQVNGIAAATINHCDGIKAQVCRREVADCQNRIITASRIDDDLFDLIGAPVRAGILRKRWTHCSQGQ